MPSLVVGTVGATLATVGLVANVADTGAKTASVFETGKLILNPASGSQKAGTFIPAAGPQKDITHG